MTTEGFVAEVGLRPLISSDDLKACRAALRVCRSLPARPETTAAWDRALTAVEEVLSGSVNGSPAPPPRDATNPPGVSR